MTFKYKLIKNTKTNKVDQVRRSTDGDWASNELVLIPFDDDNSDYIDYKDWVEAGNTAEAAD